MVCKEYGTPAIGCGKCVIDLRDGGCVITITPMALAKISYLILSRFEGDRYVLLPGNGTYTCSWKHQVDYRYDFPPGPWRQDPSLRREMLGLWLHTEDDDDRVLALDIDSPLAVNRAFYEKLFAVWLKGNTNHPHASRVSSLKERIQHAPTAAKLRDGFGDFWHDLVREAASSGFDLQAIGVSTSWPRLPVPTAQKQSTCASYGKLTWPNSPFPPSCDRCTVNWADADNIRSMTPAYLAKVLYSLLHQGFDPDVYILRPEKATSSCSGKVQCQASEVRASEKMPLDEQLHILQLWMGVDDERVLSSGDLPTPFCANQEFFARTFSVWLEGHDDDPCAARVVRTRRDLRAAGSRRQFSGALLRTIMELRNHQN